MKKELPPQNLEQLEHLFGKGFESDAASAMHEGLKKRDGSPEKNEDATLTSAEHALFGIADGMGGHAGGDIASRLAREKIEEIVSKFPKNLTAEQTRETLETAFAEAHQKIKEYAEENPDYEGMGTTASVIKIWEKGNERKAIIGHVGDSRVYVLRKDGTLAQITEDDSQADPRAIKNAHEKLVDEGLPYSALEADERHAFQYRNAISQAMGTGNITPHFYVVDIEEGEQVLITSDGIHDNLTDKEIYAILTAQGIGNSEKVQNLIRAAQERSRMDRKTQPAAKPDDMSAVLIEIQRQIKGKMAKELRVGQNAMPGWKISSINKEKGTATLVPEHIENPMESPIRKEIALEKLQ